MSEIITRNDVILEHNQLLSQSLIWQLQRNYYSQQGIEAWRQDQVHHFITSNPFIAHAYAKVVLGFLRDCQTSPVDAAIPDTKLNPEEPLYILELGAGAGRFSYHFLKAFLRLRQGSVFESIPFVYVMTDIAEKLIEYWRSHPALHPFVAAGILDFAHFDVVSDQTLSLMQSGQTLTAAGVKNPMVVLANYIFDTIPQDGFYFKENQIFKSLITVTSTQEELDLADPSILTRLQTRYEHKPTSANYYGDADYDQLLQTYQHELEETMLFFPKAALDCIRHLRRLSHDRLLLLTADKGYIRDQSLESWAEHALAVHGSFSMMVNYHAMIHAVQKSGGQVLCPTHQYDRLNVLAFLTGPHLHGYRETQQAYQEAIGTFGPYDFFVLCQALQPQYDSLTPQQILSYLQLCHWDASVFMDLSSTLQAQVSDETDEPLKQAILEMTAQVWEMYYPIGESDDVAFQIGMLLYAIDYYQEAITYFEYSLTWHGADPLVTYNLSVCHYALGRLDDALKWIDETLAGDPAFEDGQTLLNEIQEERRQAESESCNLPSSGNRNEVRVEGIDSG